MPTDATAINTTAIDVYSMTNRALVDGETLAFGSGRGEPTYEVFNIGVAPAASPPPSNLAASIPSRSFSKDFVTTGRRQISPRTFKDLIAQSSQGGGRIAIFVHGYNYNYQEAVFQLAELSADGDRDIVPVLFSWPSQASIRGYVSDRDAATYARDDLASLLTMLSTSTEHTQTVLIGHSMGAWLVMEALRQLHLQGNSKASKHLQVVLAAPDIDLDVFKTQLRALEQQSPPLTILVSSDDRALALSQRLSGGRPRLGNIPIDDPWVTRLVQGSDISVVDMTELPAGDRYNHNRLITLVMLGSAMDRRGGPVPFQRAGAYALDVSGAIFRMSFYPHEGTEKYLANLSQDQSLTE